MEMTECQLAVSSIEMMQRLERSVGTAHNRRSTVDANIVSCHIYISDNGLL